MGLDTLLQVAVDVASELLEQDTEQTGEQGTSQVETLLAKVVTVVELATTKSSRTQAVDHVTQEVGLLGLEALGNRDVREHLLLENVKRGALALRTRALLLLATTTNKVERSVAVLDGKRLFDTWAQQLEHGRVVGVETDV